MNRFILHLFFGIICISVSHRNEAQIKIPELWGHRVHDEAKVLSQQTIDHLEQRLKAFEDSTTNQIAILIVPSLEGENIEQFAFRASEEWKLGQKDKDNGALLAVSINDRKMRIEVGQGLEGPLPDVICGRIIRNEMAPAFRRGDYDAGVMTAIEAIILATKGEYKAEELPTGRGGGGGLGRLLFFIILFILFGFIGRRNRGKRGAGWSSGAGWFIGGSGGGWGGGGGGGGFSGGGGSFGGGGSSGSW